MNALTLFASGSEDFRQLLEHHGSVNLGVFGEHLGFSLHRNATLDAFPFASSSLGILGFFLFFTLLSSLGFLAIFAVLFVLLLVIVTTSHLQEFLLEVGVLGVII